jgi:carboxylate-amine ligase
VKLEGAVKPEITESMIELNSAVQRRYEDLLAELVRTRDAVCAAADKLNLAVAGGGAHPFHKWSERGSRRASASSTCRSSTATSRSSSPSSASTSTSGSRAATTRSTSRTASRATSRTSSRFRLRRPIRKARTRRSRRRACTRSPLSRSPGHVPPVANWAEFNRYFDEMAGYGIVESMKDFYWDIRPKPEYGTVEIRICDTPLTVERAAQLAGYAQTLAADLLENRVVHESLLPQYRVYGYNRFEACRFGFEAELVDAYSRKHVVLRDDLVETLKRLRPIAVRLGTSKAINPLIRFASQDQNDSRWLRERFQETRSLPDVVRLQAQRWREEPGTDPSSRAAER